MMSFFIYGGKRFEADRSVEQISKSIHFFFYEKVTLIRGLTRTVVDCEQTGLEGMARDI